MWKNCCFRHKTSLIIYQSTEIPSEAFVALSVVGIACAAAAAPLLRGNGFSPVFDIRFIFIEAAVILSYVSTVRRETETIYFAPSAFSPCARDGALSLLVLAVPRLHGSSSADSV